MYQKLVSRNRDLGRLADKGYAIAFDSNCLIVRDIPYLDQTGSLAWGSLVAKLVFIDRERVEQDDHQVYFAGSPPHGLDGQAIRNLGGGPATIQLSAACGDIAVERSFSNKPRIAGRFADFFDKMESYVAIIAGPAIEKYAANPFTFRACETVADHPVFKFQDTLTSRAQIGDLTAKLENDIVAIIGLGGTGGHLLDGLVKTPVREIRGFDGDRFHVHTSFRSPGRLAERELGQFKADVYRERYAHFRHGLTLKPIYIDETSRAELEGVTFAFVCVDKGSARAAIFALLAELGIPFIDVGMGLRRKDDGLAGMLRVTHYPADEALAMMRLGLAELSDGPGDLYRNNIQIGELNAINAALALVRYKQVRGFYREDAAYKHLLFAINDLSSVGETDFDAHAA